MMKGKTQAYKSDPSMIVASGFCGFVVDVILTSENELRSNFFIFLFLEEFV